MLATREPIARLGLRSVLEDDGIEIVGEEQVPARVVSEARRLQPDAVLLDLEGGSSRALGEQVRKAAPRAKLILWARDETVMEVLDPTAATTRRVALTPAGGLRSELLTDQLAQQTLEE